MLYIKDIKPSHASFRAFLFFFLIVFTLGIIPIGPAIMLCIVSKFYVFVLHLLQLNNGGTSFTFLNVF